MDARVLWQLSYGLYALGALDGDRPTGCIVNTVFQITSDDPSVAVSINKNNYTMEVIEKSGRFAVSILSEEVDPNVIAGLGFRCGRDCDKFADIAHTVIDGAVVLDQGLSGYLICEVVSVTDMETHNVVIARVVGAEAAKGGTPMTYKYYHEVVKGKAPKNAPTYRAPEEKAAPPATKRYVCSICGYVYEGDINEEPDSFTCPVCCVPKSLFKPQA